MVFSSPIFLFAFLPATVLVYFCVRKELQNIVLIAFSLFFYAFGEPKNVLIMLLSIFVNFGFGLLMERTRWKKVTLILALLFNLGVLYVFKYLNFTVDTINRVFGTGLVVKKIALPIGISFFTFQILSYVVDVYRGNCKSQHNLLHMALYISLFPQLIAGPIVRYTDVERQIQSREHSVDRVADGFLRFAIGFSKKVLIADQLSPLVRDVFLGKHPSLLLHWVGIIAYALQIFYDFSGYSDMAIGLGRIFGFDFAENFDYPYISRSVREFWRRWHISLSSWFKDYLYIPLGGNRKGKMRTYLNLMIVFFATGLWHGASFNFIAWGLFYGFFLVIERIGFGRILTKIPAVFQHLYTLLVILVGWVFFRADNMSSALEYLRCMFTWDIKDVTSFHYVMNSKYWFCIAAGILFSMPIVRKWVRTSPKTVGAKTIYAICTIILFVLAIVYMVGSGHSPFLYFRF